MRQYRRTFRGDVPLLGRREPYVAVPPASTKVYGPRREPTLTRPIAADTDACAPFVGLGLENTADATQNLFALLHAERGTESRPLHALLQKLVEVKLEDNRVRPRDTIVPRDTTADEMELLRTLYSIGVLSLEPRKNDVLGVNTTAVLEAYRLLREQVLAEVIAETADLVDVDADAALQAVAEVRKIERLRQLEAALRAEAEALSADIPHPLRDTLRHMVLAMDEEGVFQIPPDANNAVPTCFGAMQRLKTMGVVRGDIKQGGTLVFQDIPEMKTLV